MLVVTLELASTQLSLAPTFDVGELVLNTSLAVEV